VFLFLASLTGCPKRLNLTGTSVKAPSSTIVLPVSGSFLSLLWSTRVANCIGSKATNDLDFLDLSSLLP
jgi:hypothetical protein